MSPKTLKIALVVSVALNLFAAAAGVTAVVTRAKVDQHVADQRGGDRRGPPPMMAAVDAMDPEARDRVRQALRASALGARSDFEASRADRRAAIALAAGGTMDAAQVRALLERSRAAELRGRARLEDGAVEVLSSLEAEDRKALAPILNRHGGRDRGGRERRGERPVRP